MQRYFINQELTTNLKIEDTEIVHHMYRVMRNKNGDKFILTFNGKSAEYQIQAIFKEQIQALFVHEIDFDRELNVNIDMGIGFLKKDNFELSIQKLTELGVNQIVPITFKRNVVKIYEKKWPKKKQRYQEIIKSASKQSHRSKIPEISDMRTLKEIDYDAYDLVIVCYELEVENHLFTYQNQLKNSKNVLVVIGPEGGIDEQEITYLKNYNHTNVITLGKRILRAETAIMTTMGNIAMLIEGE